MHSAIRSSCCYYTVSSGSISFLLILDQSLFLYPITRSFKIENRCSPINESMMDATIGDKSVEKIVENRTTFCKSVVENEIEFLVTIDFDVDSADVESKRFNYSEN